MELTFKIDKIEQACGKPIVGVFHVGAAVGQEKDAYKAADINDIIWVEPLNDQFAKLKANCPDDICYQCALGETEGTAPMYTTTKQDASSLLEMYRLKEFSKKKPGPMETVNITTMDKLVESEVIDMRQYNLLVIDVQGGELMTLRGGKKTVPNFDAIVIEVNDIETYKGCPTWKEVHDELESLGFEVVKKVKINNGQSDVLLRNKQ